MDRAKADEMLALRHLRGLTVIPDRVGSEQVPAYLLGMFLPVCLMALSPALPPRYVWLRHVLLVTMTTRAREL